MTTLIIPCGGKSSRFPNMRPKWLLTHPDGKLMIQKVLESFDLSYFSRIIITLIRKHDEEYNASLILKQALEGINFEICILDEFTKSASETIYQTIKKMNVSDDFVIKDSDNFIKVSDENALLRANAVIGYPINNGKVEITNISGKSFLLVNSQGILIDIVEKQIVSDIVCLGIYCFSDTTLFCEAFESLNNDFISGELYISNIVSYLIHKESTIFNYVPATDYSDWGTFAEWKIEQEKRATYFVDFDGVLIKNSGKYGLTNWSNNFAVLNENCAAVKQLIENGAQVVITTSRPESYREQVLHILADVGIKPYAMVMGLNHAPRVLVNDFAPSNPYPSARAISFPRDSNLGQYLK